MTSDDISVLAAKALNCAIMAFADDDRCGVTCDGVTAICETMEERLATVALEEYWDGPVSPEAVAMCLNQARIVVADWLLDGFVAKLYEATGPGDRAQLGDLASEIVSKKIAKHIRERDEAEQHDDR